MFRSAPWARCDQGISLPPHSGATQATQTLVQEPVPLVFCDQDFGGMSVSNNLWGGDDARFFQVALKATRMSL